MSNEKGRHESQRKKASKVNRKVSRKFPQPGRGGRKKQAILSEYNEPKSSLNLSLTATAKLKLKQEWSEKYNLPLTDIFEQLARSPQCMETVPKILKLEERSQIIQKLREPEPNG